MKSNISNTKIKAAILSILFSILFIITALQFQTPLITQARPTIDATDTGGLTYNPSTKSWEATGMGESGEEGISIPDSVDINGTDTTGSVTPTYTYWAGDTHRCGVICYVIDLSTNKMDSAYKPFIMVNSKKDSNEEYWQGMVNASAFPLRTGDKVYKPGMTIAENNAILPVSYSGSWESNGEAVKSDLLSEDPTYQYKMIKYWSKYGNLSDTQLKKLIHDISDKKKTLAFETVSAQSFFTNSSADSVERLNGLSSSHYGFTREGASSSINGPGAIVRVFTTEYGFAQHYASKGIAGLEGSTLNWKWFQATAGSMILQESAAGINVPNGNTSIGSISSSEAATQNNGYAIIMLKITLPPIHTFKSSTSNKSLSSKTYYSRIKSTVTSEFII